MSVVNLRSPPRPGRFSRLLHETRGVAAIEFALVAAPLLALLLGMLQVSFIFFAGQVLETFTETTGRSILVGAIQSDNYTQAQFLSSLCSTINSMFRCSNLYVDVTKASSFSSATTSLPQLTFDGSGNVTNSWNYNLGTSGNIVVLRLMYRWPVYGLPLGITFANQADGSRLLMATAVFKNEQ